ncbi:hypothetical protein [Psychroserpens algicola]|uniref:Uncharacterized protein n=1 Tax=Psychroserpens algicola TaxID=1719034 RepID=A0ABT0HBW7_9FLAO|nr:hypothetical protein [Psychroserpens algicola]MCK8481390.1 hypothetical protein [Psychroserpens algicola]
MRTVLLSFTFLMVSVMSFGQDEASLGVLESDTTWLKEIIKFPIGFAPEINYTGYEDLRFAKQWRAIDHDDFWCYMFVWHVDGVQKPSAKDLEQQLKLYYDGLMKAVNKKKDFEVPETTVLVINAKGDATSDFIGKLKVYDSFNSEAIITLNVQVKLYHCITSNRTNIMFKLSPLDFDEAIWERFKDVKLTDGDCTLKN